MSHKLCAVPAIMASLQREIERELVKQKKRSRDNTRQLKLAQALAILQEAEAEHSGDEDNTEEPEE